jgi:hypothetical protein
VVRTIKARPVELIDRDRSRTLPPVPAQLGWRERLRLGRDRSKLKNIAAAPPARAGDPEPLTSR